MKSDNLMLILVAVAGYFAYKNGMLASILGSGGGKGAMTEAQACAAARTLLGAQFGYWNTASCAEIKSHVCGDHTLLIDPSQAPIRAAFGCPLT